MHIKKRAIVLGVIALFTLFPTQAFAVDYSISAVSIYAHVQTDGTVSVTEHHTYNFEGEFNGITRELPPKKGTSIDQFTSTEGGKKLKVERDGDLYKVYRSGNDEVVTIELRYEIDHAVTKFEDAAEFYWPFFDKRNDSEYEKLTITVIPPTATGVLDFLGYDEAYQTGTLENTGAVQFRMGQVPSSSNGDIRVAFDAQLFPSLTEQPGTILSDIVEDKERLEEAALVFSSRQDTSRTLGNVLLPILGALLLAITAWAWKRERKTKQQAQPKTAAFFVPTQIMSIPATLYFTKSSILTPAVTVAALMELVRKHNIEQLTDNQFRLINRDTEFDHEATLIALLFDKIGDGDIFETKDLENYTKNELNHAAYNDSITKWQQQVAAEVKQYEWYEKHVTFRWTVGFIGLALAGFAIFLGVLNLFPWMIASLILAVLFFVFCFYSPIVYEGHVIREEWKQLRLAMENLDPAHWHALSQDEKMRAYAYLLGADEKSTNEKTQSFTQAYSDSAFADFGVFYNPVLLTGLFVAANTSTSASASSSSSISGGGGGIGGGGGGSGAF